MRLGQHILFTNWAVTDGYRRGDRRKHLRRMVRRGPTNRPCRRLRGYLRVVLLLLPGWSFHGLHPEHHGMDRRRRFEGRHDLTTVQRTAGHARRAILMELPVRHVRPQLRRIGRPGSDLLRRMVQSRDVDRDHQAGLDYGYFLPPGLLHRVASHLLRCRGVHGREDRHIRRRRHGTHNRGVLG